MGGSNPTDRLLDFIHRSPTPYHAVDNACRLLRDAGFQPLPEAESWPVDAPAGYATRDDGSLIAFRRGRRPVAESGIRVAGTHTDSPCLRLRPQPIRCSQGYGLFNIEPYGGVLLHPWYDRDLSIAGRVSGSDAEGRIVSALVDFREPVAFVPSLAIHLDREANKGRKINPQTELSPLAVRLGSGIDGDNGEFDFERILLERLDGDGRSMAKVLSWDLLLYDVQPPSRVGLRGEFIASARLDNLLSTYIALRALLETGDEYASMIVCNDHEEVGSVSASGAQGPFLRAVLHRLIAGGENGAADALPRVMRNSLMLSIDNAHGVHPNFADKHDRDHRPMLNGGPVIKSNANQRYAGGSAEVALFKTICARAGVPLQSFVNRADLACGSTIGPLTAAELGIPVLDIGVAQFGMHSIRELAGAEDPGHLLTGVKAFFERLA